MGPNPSFDTALMRHPSALLVIIPSRSLPQMRKSSSLQSFREYRRLEAEAAQQASVTSDGTLLEFETLELRLHP